jgi:Spy/CpxP family protein refolding chaperone
MTFFKQSGKRATLVGTALLLVTFVAGALAGAATERVTRADDTAHPQPRATNQMRGGLSRLLADEQFAQQLALTAEQRAAIKTILERRDREAKNFWSQAEPRLKSLGEATKAEIKQVLTPEQVTSLETEMAKRHAMWKDRHKCHASDSTKSGARI